MRVDALAAEIGSTTTAVNAFFLGDKPRFLGQGVSPTTVHQNDVTIGLKEATKDLARNLGVKAVECDNMMAASSAAGGLSMTVHGLVYDMTVRAAKEAALGAGAIVRLVTAGDITSRDIERIDQVKPKIILLAGGVDYGEKATAIENARILADYLGAHKGPVPPVIYAGNIAAKDEVAGILRKKHIRAYFVDNVFPKVDQLVVEPARKVIQKVFQEHITTAPGMDTIRSMVNGPIMPTPGAVMESCELLWPLLGDLCAIDVGGATTDVHSVAKGSPEIQHILESPEPFAKRTVEGDLGVFVNAKNVFREASAAMPRNFGFDPEFEINDLESIPKTSEQKMLVSYLAEIACSVAFSRHVGKMRYVYGPTGRQALATGKDLSAVKTIIGTGGALTRLEGGLGILKRLADRRTGGELYPKNAIALLDTDYIMAPCGVLARQYPRQAKDILWESLGLELIH